MTFHNVLVLDPAASLYGQLSAAGIGGQRYHHVESAASAARIVERENCGVGLIVFDPPSRLPEEAVEHLLAATPNTEWIAVVRPESAEDPAFQRFMLDAFHDFHTLPVDLRRLAITIGHAAGRSSLRQALALNDVSRGRFGICGASPQMMAFFRRLEKVVDAELPVLINGESGTGKELVARAIHQHSRRLGGPFVVINCGAIPANLIQSELFGHEKGAFTGAAQRKIGSIEAANGGVLFLDEIGDLPLGMQTNLLRVLQERSIIRVGATQPVSVDFRLVAATNVDLLEAIRTGGFREDLYYRLNVIQLVLPPLRERRGDVRLLAETVLRNFSAGVPKGNVGGFGSEALRAMNAYHWPGNVRELINRVHRAAIMSDNRLITAADLGLESFVIERHSVTLEAARASFERDIVESSLRANGNNVTRAAQQLGVSRVTLYRIMNKLNVGVNP